MIPNKIYMKKVKKRDENGRFVVNKQGKQSYTEVFSPFKQFIGLNLSIVWQWISILGAVLIPIGLIVMLAISHQHLEAVIGVSLGFVWLFVFLIPTFVNAYGVLPYIYNRNVDAKTPDKKGLICALFALNWGMFILIFKSLSAEERTVLKIPFQVFKPKKKKKKAKKTKKNKKEKK